MGETHSRTQRNSTIEDKIYILKKKNIKYIIIYNNVGMNDKIIKNINNFFQKNNVETFYFFNNIEVAIGEILLSRFMEIIMLLLDINLEKFFELIEKNVSNFYSLIKIFILNNKKKEKSYKKIEKFKCAFFTKDFIINDLNSFYDIISISESYEINKTPITEYPKNEELFTFEFIDNKKQLVLPITYQDLISKPNQEEINEFNKFLLNKFSDNKEIREIVNQLLSNKNEIPNEVLIKYWLRIYTFESFFYKDLNTSLKGKGKLIKEYFTYLKFLYYGLKLKVISNVFDRKLYRGSKIYNSEISSIKKRLEEKEANKKFPNLICYCKPFFSTSLKKMIALGFIEKNKQYLSPNESLVLFKIKKGENYDEELVSNVDLSPISYYENESEILFFPFSCFEVKSIQKKYLKDQIEYYSLNLLYLGKYKEELIKEEKVNNLDEIVGIPKTDFVDCVFKPELINLEEIKKEEEEKKEEKKKFNFKIDDYVPKENPNYIISEFNIEEKDLNKEIRIINYNNNNNSCEVYLNNTKINFTNYYNFQKEGKYTFKFDFKNNIIQSLSRLFYQCSNLISLDFSKFNSEQINDMSLMCYYCVSLNFISFDDFNSKNVTDMKFMFFECYSLKVLDLRNLNFEKVKDLSYIFNGCEQLEKLYLPNCDYEGKKLENCFDYCHFLESIQNCNDSPDNLFKIIIKTMNENKK